MTSLREPAADATARQVGEVLARSRELCDPALHEAVDALPRSMRRIAGYHLGWWDESGAADGGDSGKAFRPALVLLSAEAVGAAPATAVPAAVGTELVHNFSLLHDDVMDEDTTRRHRPTAWTVFGRNAAILAGDALLALATDVLAASGHERSQEAVRALGATVLDLVDGQSADLEFERRQDVGLGECLAMVGSKTGSLLGCACALGGLFGGAAPQRIGELRAFGELLGLAFQHTDDLLGIWGDPEVTGKSSYSDLRARKKSLPVLAALHSGTAAGAELAELYRREQAPGPEELPRVAELVEEAGGRSWSRHQAEQLLEQALGRLRAARPAERPAAELADLATMATHRDH
jgi:geranylgeranyl diphosphate synthase type I